MHLPVGILPFAAILALVVFLRALALALIALLIVRGFWISIHARNRYSFLAGCGITAMLALQVTLNVAVCTNLIPCTGISLPFFSYGGTALLIQMAEAGILLSISREIPGAAPPPSRIAGKEERAEERSSGTRST